MLIFQDLETSTQSARIRTGVNEMMTRFATRDIDTLLAEMSGREKRVLVLLSIGSLAALRESSGAMGCSGAWGGGGLWKRREGATRSSVRARLSPQRLSLATERKRHVRRPAL